MKPHIKKLGNRYICHIVIAGTLFMGTGETVEEAYLNWKDEL